jgi:serine protease
VQPARSNYGATSVQVAAPGTQILSTWIYPSWNGGTQYYTRLTGTSMAAPHVAGAAALAIAASGGTLSNAQVRAVPSDCRRHPACRARCGIGCSPSCVRCGWLGRWSVRGGGWGGVCAFRARLKGAYRS